MDRDRLLVRLARHGNKAAFGKLALKYRDPVLAIAYDFLNDYHTAQDIAQDVFIRAFKNIGDFEEKSRFSSWLYGITVNLSLDMKKRKYRRRFFLSKTDESVRKNQQYMAQVEQNELNDTMRLALKKLSDDQQTAIILRYFHNLPIREIADVLDSPESAIRINIHQAFQKLDKSFKKGK